MEGHAWRKFLLFSGLLLSCNIAAAQESPNPAPAYGPPGSGGVQQAIVALPPVGYEPQPYGPAIQTYGQAPQYDGPAPQSDDPQPQSQPAYTSASLAPAVPLDQQVADLAARIGKLETPAPVKYPANVQVLGVFQVDGVTFNQDDANRAPIAQGGVGFIENGADFRRARLAAKAALANNMNAFMQFDFGFPGRPTFTDLWVEWTDLPWLGNFRVGQWKQPFSLEVVSSFRYTTFMERSSMFQAFTPFRHIGAGFYNHADDLNSTWAASYLRTGQDQFGGSLSTQGGNGFAGRYTHLFGYDEVDGRSYLHLGGAYYLNSPPRHAIAFRSIPEIFVGQNADGSPGSAGFAVPGAFDGTPFFVNTGRLTNVEHVHTLGLELLKVYGPLSVQAEAMAVLVDRSTAQTAALDGAYIQVGYFLTGEHRPYDRIAGAIDRVKPFEDFFLVHTNNGLERGLGAWEVAVRFSHIDLNDADGLISGGQMDNITFGVNWYCNPYCKVVFNYIHSWRQSPTSPPNDAIPLSPANSVASEANAFGLRTQIDF